jgi:hypothetical protein
MNNPPFQVSVRSTRQTETGSSFILLVSKDFGNGKSPATDRRKRFTVFQTKSAMKAERGTGR